MTRLFALVISSWLLVALLGAACSSERFEAGVEGRDDAQEMAPQVSLNAIQLAVTSLMMKAGVGELDASYDEVDTAEEIRNVTAGEGAYSLYDYLGRGIELFTVPVDIDIQGKVSID